MELKLVYRALRQLSHWALTFYSDVYVEGQENVLADGPLIIVATHNNEILDIANLAVTIPHGRMLSFWAKSSMFKHPVTRAIMKSSGAIPVYRNANGEAKVSSGVLERGTSTAASLRASRRNSSSLKEAAGGASGGKPKSKALFEATFRALDADGTVGIFPEGTSYTEPRIYQVKDGAARVALEYIKWAQDHVASSAIRLNVVPVGIVYTDKTRYQSRVCVRYGRPIDLSVFAEHFLNASGEASQRSAVQALSTEIKKALFELTVNAPNWDTLYAGTMARDILWDGPDNIPASRYVAVVQSLVDIFATSQPSASLTNARCALLKYHSLLYHAGLSHQTLPTGEPSSLTLIYAIIKSASCLVPSLPSLLIHLPAYLISKLLACLLAETGADETQAEYQASGGVLGAGISYAILGSFLTKYAQRIDFRHNSLVLWAAGTYAARVVLGRWHSSVAHFNYEQLQRLRASWTALLGLLLPGSFNLSPEAVKMYAQPPLPPRNAHLHHPVEDASLREPPPAVSSVRLIRHVLQARTVAEAALHALVREHHGKSDSFRKVLPPVSSP